MTTEHDPNLLEIFAAEAQEYTARLKTGIQALEDDPGDQNALDSLLRTIHTLKGSAMMLGFETIGSTAESIENTLFCIRDGAPDISDALDSLKRRSNTIFQLVDALTAGATTDQHHGG
jgi:chemotaxis protein histidine kinase CheA